MKKLIPHIEFLILQHEYVIVPGFGGFILNHEPAYIHESGMLIAPSLRIGFNADMKFNDGLLAGSFMEVYGCDYEEAIARVNESVNGFNRELARKKELEFGSLGSFKLEQGRLLFVPSPVSCKNHPLVWGYTDVELKKLVDLPVERVNKKEKRFGTRRIVASAASVAAAVLIGFVSFSIDMNTFTTIQQSGFFMNKVDDMNLDQAAQKIVMFDYSPADRNYIIQERIVEAESYAKLLEAKQKETEAKSFRTISQKRFYVIIGGETDKKRVDAMLSGFRKRGFNNAALLESPDRYRIYIASFNTQAEANRYLNNFRTKYPSFSDAWILPRNVMVKVPIDII